MEIADGYIKLDKPVTEINIYIQGEEEHYKAKITSVKIDKLNRIYIRVE